MTEYGILTHDDDNNPIPAQTETIDRGGRAHNEKWLTIVREWDPAAQLLSRAPGGDWEIVAEVPRAAQLWVRKNDPEEQCIVQKITDAGVYGMYYRTTSSDTNHRAMPMNTFLLDYKLS